VQQITLPQVEGGSSWLTGTDPFLQNAISICQETGRVSSETELRSISAQLFPTISRRSPAPAAAISGTGWWRSDPLAIDPEQSMAAGLQTSASQLQSQLI
jgi:hypothetical protein